MATKNDNCTIYDIASEAGVSIATVSRVLNHPDRVGKKTRQKVESAFTKYNYFPNAIARGLVTNTMKTIGIAAPDFGHLPNSSTIQYLENCFFEHEYNSIICSTSYDVRKIEKYFQILAEKMIDGLVLVSSVFSEPSFADIFTTHLPNTPIIMINGILDHGNAYSILNDNIVGMQLIVDHLVSKGHKNIVFVRNAPSYNSMQKQAGYIQEMTAHGLSANQNSIFVSEDTLEGGSETVDRILFSAPNTTAIICADDFTAAACAKRLKQLDIRIPGDIAVTGYDNTTFGKICDPMLTTIDTKFETLSEIAANTLFSVLDGQSAGSPIYVRPRLIVRESS